jgi:endogenous inhibitor of DNA gyrase (YacG/DUF329 family)
MENNNNNRVINKQDLEEYLYFKSLVKTNNTDVARMQSFLNKHIDDKAIICKTCSAQIRFYHQMIINWGIRKEIENIDFKKEKEERQNNEVNCVQCDKLMILPNDKKHKKYCSQECERIYKDKKYNYNWYDENGKSIKTEKPLDENGEVKYKSNAEIIYEKLDKGELKPEDVNPFTIKMFKIDLTKYIK